ncbi:NUDIX hydrolase [Schleiferilactobacillus perolens]|jgi:8-oxo-dGTP diphosphatase|uniref:NUDIX hydrolase n=1 Tax=Schleiferilactobacillus perolens TaxID=100468 RepID=UPI002357B4BB|nr:NUDIX domain-containing protein [Schleiferilactobacillus perolens]MCI2172457.1 NUDIX domain-containing protein [Schleiferilactobacillus perolens]
MAKYKYTLALITDGRQILMLNRFKPPYPGLWNGIGGKVETGETPLAAGCREIMEETTITADEYTMAQLGVIDWYVNGEFRDGIYLFRALLHTPISHSRYPQWMREGILQPYRADWLTRSDNTGVVPDVQRIIPEILAADQLYVETNFEAERLTHFALLDPVQVMRDTDGNLL